MDNLFEKLTDPKNRYEQVEAVAFDVLNDPVYFNALKYLPERCKAAALKLFDQRNSAGYRADVIRAALRQYAAKSPYIDENMQPYTNLELSL